MGAWFEKRIGGTLMAIAILIGLPPHWPFWVNIIVATVFLIGLDLHDKYRKAK